jgi:hypothetical protein
MQKLAHTTKKGAELKICQVVVLDPLSFCSFDVELKGFSSDALFFKAQFGKNGVNFFHVCGNSCNV